MCHIDLQNPLLGIFYGLFEGDFPVALVLLFEFFHGRKSLLRRGVRRFEITQSNIVVVDTEIVCHFACGDPLADHLALFRIVGGCTLVLRVCLLVLLGGVVVLLFGGYRLFGVLLGIGFERFDLVPHRCKAFDYGLVVAVFPMA